VSYLNSKPLIEGLDQLLEGHATLRLDYPSRLADDLASGALDVALIPSIEYFRGGVRTTPRRVAGVESSSPQSFHPARAQAGGGEDADPSHTQCWRYGIK
jgi:hypothetical protein